MPPVTALKLNVFSRHHARLNFLKIQTVARGNYGIGSLRDVASCVDPDSLTGLKLPVRAAVFHAPGGCRTRLSVVRRSDGPAVSKRTCVVRNVADAAYVAGRHHAERLFGRHRAAEGAHPVCRHAHRFQNEEVHDKKFEAKRRSSDKAGADLRASASLREIG